MLTIRQHTPSDIPLEVDALRLETMREQSVEQILRIPIQRGNQQVDCGEFFEVSGSASDHRVTWEDTRLNVKCIGAAHSQGEMHVAGDVGMHAGAGMSGGLLDVQGHAADWVGAEMTGGRIHVRGDAGDLVGAAYRGSPKGMRGGEIYIHGNAGHEVGQGMRRGLIAVGGNVGVGAAVRMIAGSLFVCGTLGDNVGMGMKRGTVALLSSPPNFTPLPSFRWSCTYQPVFLQLYLRHIQQQGLQLPDSCWNTPYQRYCGDLLELGRGELLITSDNPGS